MSDGINIHTHRDMYTCDEKYNLPHAVMALTRHCMQSQQQHIATSPGTKRHTINQEHRIHTETYALTDTDVEFVDPSPLKN